MENLFKRKPINKIISDSQRGERLQRALGPLALTLFGIGCIIGTGIFVLTGIAAHDKTGPALILSFVFSGFACVLAALCYAEFASMVPVAGSAYTYGYATLGELFAWIIGWDLVLEYSVAAASVAHGWSHYVQELLAMFGINLPYFLTKAPFDFDPSTGHFATTGTCFDFLSVFIVILISAILVKGIKESAKVNAFMVFIKVAVVLFVIIIGAFFVMPENWTPFAPYGYTGLSLFGKTVLGQSAPGGQPVGMLAGAAMMFFAYIGFDSVSTQAEEAKNPQRDMPIAIIASLVICTILYIGVSAILTGMVPYNEISIDAPIAEAFGRIGMPWVHFIITAGGIAGITSVILVLMLGQARILLAISRDGLLPESFFGSVHPRFHTPWKSTILTGIVVACISGVIPLRILAELVNIGTLLAFVIVCAGVLVMRKTDPNTPRPFKVPLVPFIPLGGIFFCLLLMFSLPSENWLRLLVWLLLGLAIYFFYGRHRSKLNSKNPEGR